MRVINNFESVQASTGEFDRPSAGGYIVEIRKVEDFPLDANTNKGDYLRIEYDICEGDFDGYYTKQNEKFGGKWFASFIRSYKDSAAGMFKHFVNCVEESNSGYKWAWQEQSLAGKRIGVVLCEEEYVRKDGTVGTKLIVKEIKTVAQITTGDFKIPPIKKLQETTVPNAVKTFDEMAANEDLPF